MIKGIGTDIVDVATLQHLYERQPALAQRLLSEDEYVLFQSFKSQKRQIEFLAGRYAAKEAFVKALGTGIRSGLNFKDIDIKNDRQGAPYILCQDYKVWVSISHHVTQAIAMVVIEEI